MNTQTTTLRRFFLPGIAILCAGLVTTAGATMLSGPKRDAVETGLDAELAMAADREAIRQLHLSFTSLIESQRYAEAAALFDDQAQLDLSGEAAAGRPAIEHLLTVQYGQQEAGSIHSAYRPNALQKQDTLSIAEDHRHATAIYHLDVAVCAPVQGNCTEAQMEQAQGPAADRRWESGRFIAKYVKVAGTWRMSVLRFVGA